MKSLKEILSSKTYSDSHRHITREFQAYGVFLSETLSDQKHKSLYIKLAKEIKREKLEKALNFAIDYPSARRRAKLFMWKLGEMGVKITPPQSSAKSSKGRQR